MDYDNETDRLVGFVLLCTEKGILCTDFFVASSFQAMMEAFQSGMHLFIWHSPLLKVFRHFVWHVWGPITNLLPNTYRRDGNSARSLALLPLALEQMVILVS